MRLKGKKELVIIIPGPNFIKGLLKPLQDIILWFYAKVNIGYPVYTNYAENYARILDRKNREAVWLHWSRHLTPGSTKLAIKKLDRLIHSYKNKHKIKIVGISMGGEIALESLKKWDKGEVDRLVLLCPVIENKGIHFKKIKVYNIFSEDDLFAKISVKALSPFKGDIKGTKIKNILIPGFGHDNFCNNDRIKKGTYKGRKISEVINKFLKI